MVLKSEMKQAARLQREKKLLLVEALLAERLQQV